MITSRLLAKRQNRDQTNYLGITNSQSIDIETNQEIHPNNQHSIQEKFAERSLQTDLNMTTSSTTCISNFMISGQTDKWPVFWS